MPDQTAPMSTTLRTVADLLDANPDFPMPAVTQHGVIWWIYPWEVEDVAATAASIRRTIGGTWDKREAEGGEKLALTSTQGGISFKVEVLRDNVCTSRVVGTETVTIPAVEAQPEQTVERDVVEWDCAPILADEPIPYALAEGVRL